MRQDETATKDMKMGETPTWTRPNPHNGKKTHLHETQTRDIRVPPPLKGPHS